MERIMATKTDKETFNIDTYDNYYAVKNVKSFMGREGLGFECSLYKNNKRIGTVTDTANGGMIDFYLDKGEEELLDTYCEQFASEVSKFPTKSGEYKTFEHKFDSETLLNKLVQEFETKAKLKKLCKNKTVFTLTTDTNPNDVWTKKIPFSAKVKEHLQKEYGDTLKEILNEKL